MGPLTDVYLYASLAGAYGLFALLIWVYFSAIRGVYQLGSAPLHLRAFHEDPMLGTRPVGVLSLSLAFAYFATLGLSAVGLFLQPQVEALLVSLGALIAFGAVMFSLPLYSDHGQMLGQKRLAHAAVRPEFLRIAGTPHNPSADPSSTTLADLKRVLVLDLVQREVAVLPTWPFDTQILGRLTAIILTVIASSPRGSLPRRSSSKPFMLEGLAGGTLFATLPLSRPRGTASSTGFPH